MSDDAEWVGLDLTEDLRARVGDDYLCDLQVLLGKKM